MCMPSPGTTSELKCAESWNCAVSAARTMSHKRGISEWRHAGPLMALMTGTSMFNRFINRCRPSQWMRSIRSIDGRVGKEDVPGVARGPENSAPVPVRITTRFSRSDPMSWKASGNSPCGRKPQRSDWPSVCRVTCKMPSRRSIRAVLYLLAYSSNELISASRNLGKKGWKPARGPSLTGLQGAGLPLSELVERHDLGGLPRSIRQQLVRGLRGQRRGARRLCRSDVELQGEVDRRVGKAHDCSKGDGQLLRLVVKAQGNRKVLLPDVESPELMLQDDRHLFGIFGLQVVR